MTKSLDETAAEPMEFHEAIRKRPAMYTGSTRYSGFRHILTMIFSPPCAHQYYSPSPHQRSVEADHVSFELTGPASGIFRLVRPRSNVTANFSENLFYHNDFAVLNALSRTFESRLFGEDGDLFLEQIHDRGIRQSGPADNREHEFHSMEIKFSLDSDIWEPLELNPYLINETVCDLAFLNPDKIFEVLYQSSEGTARIIHEYPNGLRDLVTVKARSGWGESICPLEFKVSADTFTAEICVRFLEYSVDPPFFESFANHIFTLDGGTHVDALISGIRKALKKYVKEHYPDEIFVIRRRTILKSIVGAIHIISNQPSFYGSVKNKLINREFVKPIANYTYQALYEKLRSDEKIAWDVVRHFCASHWK